MLIVHKIKDISNFSYHINCPRCGKPYFQKSIADGKPLLSDNLPAKNHENSDSLEVTCCHLTIRYEFPDKEIKEIHAEKNIKLIK